jgi:hypothetical protein
MDMKNEGYQRTVDTLKKGVNEGEIIKGKILRPSEIFVYARVRPILPHERTTIGSPISTLNTSIGQQLFEYEACVGSDVQNCIFVHKEIETDDVRYLYTN